MQKQEKSNQFRDFTISNLILLELNNTLEKFSINQIVKTDTSGPEMKSIDLLLMNQITGM